MPECIRFQNAIDCPRLKKLFVVCLQIEVFIRADVRARMSTLAEQPDSAFCAG